MAIFSGDQGGIINDQFIDALSSDDIVYAGEGLNIIFTGEGNDKIYSGAGDDEIRAGAGDDIVYAGDGNNTVLGGEGNDKIYTGAGDDLIRAGAGDDIVYAGNGNNTVFGGGGNDKLYSGAGNDHIEGGAGNDLIHTAKGNNTVFGGNGNDTLCTGVGNDYTEGGAGNDLIHAGAGNDTIVGVNFTTFGRSEIDILEGGCGADVFVLGNAQRVFYDDGNINNFGNNDYALIKNFNRVEDTIQLKGTKDYYTIGAVASGKGVYFKDELIAIVQAPELSLDESYFTFIEPVPTTIRDGEAQSDYYGYSATSYPLTQSTFDFTGQPYDSLIALDDITIRLRLDDGDTGRSDFDFNNLTLALDGIDTGIKLNGFPDLRTVTRTISGIPINKEEILGALQADGMLKASLIDHTDPGGNWIGIPGTFETTLTITGLG